MKKIKGDIFEGSWDVLFHCANIYCTWGAGFVVPLKKKYPAAYEADLATKKGDENKFSYFSFANAKNQRIYNLYAQIGIGNDGHPVNRNLQYDFLFNSIYGMLEHLAVEFPDKKLVIACPKIGAGLAGGDWHIIKAILESIELKFPKIEFHVYYL